MKRTPKRPAAHHRDPNAAKTPSHFRQMDRATAEGNPVDVAVSRRIADGVGQRRLRRLQKQVLAQLGSNVRPFLALEELHNRMSAQRDEAYFNSGYDHGALDARACTRRDPLPLSADARRFADETRERIVHAQLSPWQVVLCLLECLWAVATEESGSGQS